MSQPCPDPTSFPAKLTAVHRTSDAAGVIQTCASHQPVLAALADVALIDAKMSAATGAMSESWWLQKVADGLAPQPVVRAHRCTRWRLADVRAFWLAFGGATDSNAAETVKAQASRASAAATIKRRQAAASAQVES